MGKNITTIKIVKKTKERLDHLKENSNETYDEVINKALNILNICLSKPLLANKLLRDIERSRKMGKLIKNPEKILKKSIKEDSKTQLIPISKNTLQNNLPRISQIRINSIKNQK